MNALLPYLKQIADALMKRNSGGDTKRNDELSSIAKNISASSTQQTNASIKINANMEEVSKTLDKGLLLSVEENNATVIKSVVVILKEALVAAFREALTVEVTENNNTVRKGVAQLLTELVAKQDGVMKALDGTNASGVGRRVYNLITPLNNINTNVTALGTKVETGAANIVTALGNISVTLDDTNIVQELNYITAHLNDMELDMSSMDNSLDDIETAVESIDQKTPSPTP